LSQGEVSSWNIWSFWFSLTHFVFKKARISEHERRVELPEQFSDSMENYQKYEGGQKQTIPNGSQSHDSQEGGKDGKGGKFSRGQNAQKRRVFRIFCPKVV
jgi:hypothetical protein